MTETTLITMPTLAKDNEGFAVAVWQRLMNRELAIDSAPYFSLSEKFIDLLALAGLPVPALGAPLLIEEDGRFGTVTDCLTRAYQQVTTGKQRGDGFVGSRTWCAVGFGTFNQSIRIGKLAPTKRTR